MAVKLSDIGEKDRVDPRSFSENVKRPLSEWMDPHRRKIEGVFPYKWKYRVNGNDVVEFWYGNRVSCYAVVPAFMNALQWYWAVRQPRPKHCVMCGQKAPVSIHSHRCLVCMHSGVLERGLLPVTQPAEADSAPF